MMTSQTPGDLGVYGFRNRSDHSYDALFIADGNAIKQPRLWDLVTRAGRPVDRARRTGHLSPTPSQRRHGQLLPHAFDREPVHVPADPPATRSRRRVGEYIFDCKDFRTEDKDYLIRQVYEMTDRRFALAEHLLSTKPWRLFAMVEMGPDRMHHGFWKFMDPEHRRYEPGNPYENAILDYHRHVDALVARLLEHADDDTVVLVVSDHGAKRMDGGIRVNEWLRREGLLATLVEPTKRSSLADVGVDWSRTVAWGEGGYYSRIFMNVRGREPEGIVDPEDYERFARTSQLGSPPSPTITGARSGPASTRPRRSTPRSTASPRTSSSILATSRGAPSGPSAATRGSTRSRTTQGRTMRTTRRTGSIVLAGPGIPASGRMDAHLLDIAPTLLELMGIEVPAAMRGESLLARLDLISR